MTSTQCEQPQHCLLFGTGLSIGGKTGDVVFFWGVGVGWKRLWVRLSTWVFGAQAMGGVERRESICLGTRELLIVYRLHLRSWQRFCHGGFPAHLYSNTQSHFSTCNPSRPPHPRDMAPICTAWEEKGCVRGTASEHGLERECRS